MNILKKQGVAWAIAIVMIVAAIGIGRAKAPHSGPDYDAPSPESGGLCYVYDDAGVLSGSTEKQLSQRNQQLLDDMGVAIAVVTCNYGKSDLGSYAIDYADSIGLDVCDFIVVLDISGDNYWLVQGSGLVDLFTDDDCSDYAWDYMEADFARGDYGDAVLNLTEALADWYYDHY